MGKDLEVAILFADVVGSTQLYEDLGDTKASETVAHCLDVMQEATNGNNGKVIKTIGDEVMATFESVDDAMNASKQMQTRISSNEELAKSASPVSIRIGCHFGPVVEENRDIFGAAVHTANRMTSQAKAGQIVTTGSTVECMGDEWRKFARQIDVATVRGRTDQVALFEVLWQPDEATSMLPTLEWGTQKMVAATRLILSYQGKTVEVTEQKKIVTMGRADDNDVVIKGNLISRIHAKVERNRGKFLLIDQSTNGTFVQNVKGEEMFIRRDSTQIVGEGIIGLGRVAQPGTALAIHFLCED